MTKHERLARELVKLQARAVADIDQAEAKSTEASQAFVDSEHNRLLRAMHAAADELIQKKSSYMHALDRLSTLVAETSPATEILEQLTRTAIARAEDLRTKWEGANPRWSNAERMAAVERAEKRDRELAAWVNIYQTAPTLIRSPTPYRGLAELLERHANVLPELRYYTVDVPDYEKELEHAC